MFKDSIADITLQQVLTRPNEFEVIATLNLNGDYLSDALAAQVGGIGIAPGGNINNVTGHAIFEATHGQTSADRHLRLIVLGGCRGCRSCGRLLPFELVHHLVSIILINYYRNLSKKLDHYTTDEQLLFSH